MNRKQIIGLGIITTTLVLSLSTSGNASPTPPQTQTDVEARAALVNIDGMKRDAELRKMLRQLTGAPTQATLEIAVIGDSMTVGYGSVDMGGYRTYLTDMFDRIGVKVTFYVDATGGWSVNEVKPSLAPFLSAHPNIDLAILCVGTNDVSWGMDLTGWGAKYDAIIQQVLNVNTKVKLVSSKIPLSATANPTGNPNISVYENAINGWMQTSVNGFTTSAPGRVISVDPSVIPSSWLLDMGWHPGDVAYMRWAQIIFTGLLNAGWINT